MGRRLWEKLISAYKNPELRLHYWRTSTGQEVDFILGDMEVAIEIKSSQRVHLTDAKGLRALAAAHTVKKLLLISLEDTPKKLTENIQCYPWEMFLQKLWAGEIIA